MWWVIIISFLLLILTYVVFMPMILHIDTVKNNYYLQLKGIAKANLLADEREILKVKLKVFFFNFYIYPFKQKKSSAKVKKNEIKPAKKKSQRIDLKKILILSKTFEVKQFRMDIDTGDYITNAKLYPLFALLNYKYGGFHINYQDRNALLLNLENRPIRIIKSFINS